MFTPAGRNPTLNTWRAPNSAAGQIENRPAATTDYGSPVECVVKRDSFSRAVSRPCVRLQAEAWTCGEGAGQM